MDVERQTSKNNILYDLTIHAEWTQETETLVRGITNYLTLFLLF